jgi:acid phosphatase class B
VTIAIDYDDTYTVDPDFWNEVIMSAQRRGHDVVVVTARPDTEETRCEMRAVFDMWEVVVHFSGDEPKADYARRNGLAVDVWVDDSPGWIVGVT